MSNLETCCVCDGLTGRAGQFEDSLYIGDKGPYCEECNERAFQHITHELSPQALDDLTYISISPGQYTGSFSTGDLLLKLGLIDTRYKDNMGAILGLSVASISPVGEQILDR